MSDRIYKLTDSETNTVTLVEAASKNEALRLFMGTRYTVEVASAVEVADAFTNKATCIRRVREPE